jgi:hypothetical protein
MTQNFEQKNLASECLTHCARAQNPAQHRSQFYGEQKYEKRSEENK